MIEGWSSWLSSASFTGHWGMSMGPKWPTTTSAGNLHVGSGADPEVARKLHHTPGPDFSELVLGTPMLFGYILPDPIHQSFLELCLKYLKIASIHQLHKTFNAVLPQNFNIFAVCKILLQFPQSSSKIFQTDPTKIRRASFKFYSSWHWLFYYLSSNVNNQGELRATLCSYRCCCRYSTHLSQLQHKHTLTLPYSSNISPSLSVSRMSANVFPERNFAYPVARPNLWAPWCIGF